MHEIVTPESAPSAERPAVGAFPLDAEPARRGASQSDADDQFVAMLKAYRATGGIARAEEITTLCRQRGGPDVATLARWISRRQVICFDWQSQTWLPFFQFSRDDLTLRPELSGVFAELIGVYSPWALANWFARPKASLANRTPVEALAYNFAAVLHAARVDRLNAGG